MIVYIVGVEDRHTDLRLTAYDTWEAARAAADRLLMQYGGPSEDDELYGFQPDDEVLWMHRYTTEGDCIWVRKLPCVSS